MREFGAPAGSDWYERIAAAAQQFFMSAPVHRDRLASEFMLEGNPERVVATEAELRWESGRMRVAMSKPSERPPFEWHFEITADIGETDYFKHYLIRAEDVVLAQRKVLTTIDETEAQLILDDLATAQAELLKA